MIDKLYRYEDIRYAPPVDEFERPIGEGTLSVELRTYIVRKHTPCGVWIDGRFVNLKANKRFACPTMEEAKESFIARKKRQIRILSARLKDAQRALEIINDRV